MGLIEDSTNRNRLIKLLRFKTNKSGDEYISLDKYLKNMKEWQDSIYYITGESIEAVENSPFLEKIKQKDLEVFYFTDPIDEYILQYLTTYEDKQLVSVTKEGIKFGDEDSNLVEKRVQAYKEQFKSLIDYLKKLYNSKIHKVTISQRVNDTPCIIVTPQHSHSANMERILRAQTLNSNQPDFAFAKKTLELNPRHPIIHQLNNLVQSQPDEQITKDTAWLLYETALLQSGFIHDNVEEFADRMHRVIGSNLGVESMDLLDEIEVPDDNDQDFSDTNSNSYEFDEL